MAIGGGANLGLTPRAVLAFELEGQARWPQLGLGFGLRYLMPGSAQDAQGHGVTISALGGHVSGLFRPTPLWEARLGVAAYRLSGSGLGSRADRDDSAWAAGPLAGIALLPLMSDRTWAAVAAELQLDLIQSRFEILDYDEVFRASRVGGSFFLRLGHSFF